jgi:HK97 family phage portal protein
VGLLRRDPYRHLPPPPAPTPAGPVLTASAPSARATTAARLESFITPDAAAITREAVWSVPAFAAGLQTIAGTVGALPLRRQDRTTWEEVTDEAGFLQQMDPEEATSATLTKLVEDLVLHPYAYLVVLGRYASGFPMWARYVPAETVTPPREAGDTYRITVDGRTWTVTPSDVIRFPAPTPGLLTIGARTILTSLALEEAARRFAAIEMPAGALKNRGADLTDAQVDALLARWDAARRTRTTAYLNAVLEYETFTWDAAQIQLVEGREHQVAEAARLLNLPARYLNAPMGSSLTYTTTEGQRRELTDLSLRPYLTSVEHRLTLADVTPRTQEVRFVLDDFLRGDAGERIAVATARIAAGITTPQEERRAERIPGRAPAAATTPPAVNQ